MILDYLKTKLDKAVTKAKECCKKSAAFFVTKLDYLHVTNLYIAIRPTTEEEAKAANIFLNVMEELKSLHPGRGRYIPNLQFITLSLGGVLMTLLSFIPRSKQ